MTPMTVVTDNEVERVRDAIRNAIGESDQLAAMKDVGEPFHGMEGVTLFYVDGAFDLDRVARAALAASDRDVLVAALREAKLQLEYLDGKFAPTGTTAAIVARIDAALLPLGGG